LVRTQNNLVDAFASAAVGFTSQAGGWWGGEGSCLCSVLHTEGLGSAHQCRTWAWALDPAPGIAAESYQEAAAERIFL